MSLSTLTSLAILKVNWDRLGADYIENFVPFVVECARLNQDDAISLPDIHASIKSTFGLHLPQNALRLIIGRATKRGYFRRGEGVIYKVQHKCDSLDFSRTKVEVESTYNRVVSRLAEYANEVHRKSWSHDDADRVLLAFLRESVPIV